RNRILGNYIGTDVTGTVSLIVPGRGFQGGILISGTSSNVLGGEEPGAGNLIVGDVGLAGANNNVVQGNLIGTDFTGTKYLAGAVTVNGNGNLIGGTTPGARNVIPGGPGFSGGRFGIFIGGEKNVVQGNYIGTDISGTVALALSNGTQ